MHPDINLAVRSYTETNAYDGYVWIDGPTDDMAPHLNGLFADHRLAELERVHRVFEWDWQCNCLRGPISEPEVTLASLKTEPGEIVYVPASGYSIGDGFEVLVLYAEPHAITLKYSREDSVAIGYTLHLEGVCVESRLLALYRATDAAGRKHLPALREGQAIGRAENSELELAVRDSGSFMDPRSFKDWWR